MDTDEARSWVEAERQDKFDKVTKKKLENIKWVKVSMKVPVCPECGTPMDHELDTYARESWKWVCSNCRHTI
jgi:transposase-like protein